MKTQIYDEFKKLGLNVINVDISNVWDWFMHDDQKQFYDISDPGDFPVIMNPFDMAVWKISGVIDGSTATLYYLSIVRDLGDVISTDYHLFVGYLDYKYKFTTVTINCDRNGVYAGELGENLQIGVVDSWYSKKLLHEQGEEGLTEGAKNLTPLHCLLFAINLLHCKNVELIDAPVTRQQRRMMERKKIEVWKTLDIFPFQKQIRKQANGSNGESEIKRALHVCRGHFRTYSDDAPLFGKVTGTFWVPQHMRGDSKIGKIHKDYKIHKPQIQGKLNDLL